MSSHTLRRHSRRSLPRVRTPREGPKGSDGHGNGNGPPDTPHGGDDGPGNSHGHGPAFGNDGNHGAGNIGGGKEHGGPHDNSPFSNIGPPHPPPAPPSGGGDPDSHPGGGANADAGEDGADDPPSTGGHESVNTETGNTGGSNGANSGSTPPANTNGGSSSASSVSDSDPSSSSGGAPSKTSDSTTHSSSDSPVSAQISDTATGIPDASAAVIPFGGSSAIVTPVSHPSPNPPPSSSSEVTPAAALSHPNNSGAIAGGVVGAVLFVALAFGAWIVYKRRRKNRVAPSAQYLANPSAYPFAQGFSAPTNRSVKGNTQAGNYGGAGTGAAGNANFGTLNSRFGESLDNSPQMKQYRDERPVPSSVPLPPPPQPEILYSTRPPGAFPPAVPTTPGSTPGTPTSPNGRRIPFGTGTFQFPPRPVQPQQLISPQSQ